MRATSTCVPPRFEFARAQPAFTPPASRVVRLCYLSYVMSAGHTLSATVVMYPRHSSATPPDREWASAGAPGGPVRVRRAGQWGCAGPASAGAGRVQHRQPSEGRAQRPAELPGRGGRMRAAISPPASMICVPRRYAVARRRAPMEMSGAFRPKVRLNDPKEENCSGAGQVHESYRGRCFQEPRRTT